MPEQQNVITFCLLSCIGYILGTAVSTVMARCHTASQYKHTGCCVTFEMQQRQAASISERLVDSNQSIISHIPDDWNLCQHYCGNCKPQVNPKFAAAQLQRQLTYFLTYFLTYLPHEARVLLEKLTICQQVKKLPAFYGTWRFITPLASARQLSLSWASLIQSIPPHPTS